MHKKFLVSIAIVFLLIIGVSTFIHNHVLKRYFIHTETKALKSITEYIMEANTFSYEAILEDEEKYNVSIIRIDRTNYLDNVNNSIRNELIKKGIVLDKYWLWEEDYKNIISDKPVSRIYPQKNFRYYFLVEYRAFEDDIVLVGKIIPMNDHIIVFANLSTTLILICTGIILFVIVSYLVYKIIKPIDKIRSVTESIAHSDFKQIHINTNDELELLAENINAMSINLQKTYNELAHKNNQMQELLSNVSHELKTPVALIKMYTCGIRDGLDDGSFLETIRLQNNKIEALIQKLLDLTKYENQSLPRQNINVSQTLKSIINAFRVSDTVFHCDIAENLEIILNNNYAEQIFSNLISNAVKYSSKNEIYIMLKENQSHVFLSVSNPIDDLTIGKIELDKIWDAFYVAEKSRNANLTGTGLGLALVKVLCDKSGVEYSCVLDGEIISFNFVFAKSM